MKKLILIASFLIGAIAVNAQTTPLVFKTSAGSATGTVTDAATTTIYADVTTVGSSSVSGVVTLSAIFPASAGARNCTILPVVSNDGSTFSILKTGNSIIPYVLTGATVWGVDTVMRKTDTTNFSSFSYKFPTGYKYVGFRCVGASGTGVTFTAKGLAK